MGSRSERQPAKAKARKHAAGSPAKAKARRAQILSAATSCFAKKGVRRTTMQDICRRAALSPGGVYRYFKGKADIVDAVFRANETALSASAQDRLTTEGDPLLLLMAMRDAWFDSIGTGRGSERDLRLHAEVHAEAAFEPQVQEVLKEHVARLISSMRDAIERAQGERDIDASLDAEYVARVHLALLQGLRLQKLLDPGVDPKAFHETVIAMTMGGFGPS